MENTPLLVISPEEMNQHLRTVLIAPMTTAQRPCPTRVSLTFQGKRSQVVLDQIHAVDRQRLVRNRQGILSDSARRFSRLDRDVRAPLTG